MSDFGMDPEVEKIFFEIHSDNPREGPGDFDSTRKAFQLMTNLPQRPLILDVGCGPGKQTLDLAEICDGDITAVDLYQPFVDRVNRQAGEKGLADRVRAVRGDMTKLDFEPSRFDVIWSEGAVYNMGFENGLKSWRPLLKEGGYVAVTELSWFKPGAPEELKVFWAEGYPGMRDIETNVKSVEASGYALVDQFPLPDRAWWDDYYDSIASRLDGLKAKYQGNETAADLFASEETEMEIHRKYAEYYGYAFYVMRKA